MPARRALFTMYSGRTVFPLKFCGHRWLENADVAQRAIEITPHIKNFVQGVQKDKAEPTSASYKDVKNCLNDSLLLAKIAFFKSVASEVEPFLREFQSDSPMVPFLYNDMSQMVRSIMERFMKIEKLKNISMVSTCFRILYIFTVLYYFKNVTSFNLFVLIKLDHQVYLFMFHR